MRAKKRREEIKNALRHPYTWPGAYSKAFFVYDGLLCAACVKSNLKVAFRDTSDNCGPWNVKIDVFWEGADEYCVHCGIPIESEYGAKDNACEI